MLEKYTKCTKPNGTFYVLKKIKGKNDVHFHNVRFWSWNQGLGQMKVRVNEILHSCVSWESLSIILKNEIEEKNWSIMIFDKSKWNKLKFSQLTGSWTNWIIIIIGVQVVWEYQKKKLELVYTLSVFRIRDFWGIGDFSRQSKNSKFVYLRSTSRIRDLILF